MKVVDNVDKSGLPVVIGGVELTEKDFQCITRRVQELMRIVVMHESEEILLKNCQTCAYDKECDSIWESLKKFCSITGVPISPFTRRDGSMCIPENID